MRIQIRKQHNFKSYTDRKVFESNQQIDRIFDVGTSKDLCSPKRIKQTIVPF
jgi:hypothetical protein